MMLRCLSGPVAGMKTLSPNSSPVTSAQFSGMPFTCAEQMPQTTLCRTLL